MGKTPKCCEAEAEIHDRCRRKIEPTATIAHAIPASAKAGRIAVRVCGFRNGRIAHQTRQRSAIHAISTTKATASHLPVKTIAAF